MLNRLFGVVVVLFILLFFVDRKIRIARMKRKEKEKEEACLNYKKDGVCETNE